MGTVVRLFAKNHVRKPSVARSKVRSADLACISAKASKVTSVMPRVEASATKTDQCSAGIAARDFQLLTVDGLTPSSEAAAPVPPIASIASPTVRIMADDIIRKMRSRQGFASCLEILDPGYGQLHRMVDPAERIAARLLIVRATTKMNQAQFCEELGVGTSTYSPFETGERRIPLDVAAKVRAKHGFPLDWIYYGDVLGLSGPLMTRIQEGEAELRRQTARAKAPKRRRAG